MGSALEQSNTFLEGSLYLLNAKQYYFLPQQPIIASSKKAAGAATEKDTLKGIEFVFENRSHARTNSAALNITNTRWTA